MQRRKWLRLGIATLTSATLVAGTFVPVHNTPFLNHSLVASADAQEAVLSTAEGLAIDLNLLRGFVDDEEALNEVITAIHAQQSFPENEGEGPQTTELDLTVLQAINVNLGGLSIPLVDDGSNNGLLDLGTEGVGVLGAYASAPSASEAHAAAGVITEDGLINADPSQGSSNVETNIQLTALLDQLGLGVVTDSVADDLSLRLGAVSSMAEAEGDQITSEYSVANAELYLHSPLVEDIGGLVEPGGLGADLDSTVEALLGQDGPIGEQIIGLVDGLLSGLGLGNVTLSASTDLETALDTLLGQPLTSNDGLVTIDLQSGEVIVNLEALHGDNLSNLDPNTELVNAEQLTRIVDTVDGLLESLSQQITDTLNDGVLQTALDLDVRIGPAIAPIARIALDGTLSEILAGEAVVVPETILGNLLPLPIDELVGIIVNGLVSGLGSILGDVDENGNLQVNILDGIISNLLTPVNDLLGAGASAGLSPLINRVLGEVAQITVNSQPNVLDAAAGTVPERPNARRGTVVRPNEVFSVQPARVTLLDLGTDGGVVELPLARSTVLATDEADNEAPTLLGIDPELGPREGGNEVTLTGTNLAEIDTIYVNETAITEFEEDPDTGSVTFIAPPWDDLNTTEDAVEVSVAASGVRSEPLEYTYLDEVTEADQHDPAYEWVMINPGETLPVPQTGDTTLPAGTNFEIDPNFNPPEGWTFTLTDPSTGDLEVIAPEDAPPGMVFRVPVNAIYPDGSIDSVSARMNVVMSPIGIEEIIYGDEYTTIIFTDGTEVQIPNGADGADGADGAVPEVGENGNWWIDGADTGVPATGADGADGDSIEIVSSTVDPETGYITVLFSDDNTVVIPAGQDGADGASVTVVGSELNADGDLVVSFSDGAEVVVPRGADGVDGESVTIAGESTDADGNTVIEFSDGSTVTVAKGDQGEAGQDGLSAYELWLEAGNSGDINDFLESLVGADGQDGAAGQPGVDGKTAYELWLEAGNEGSVDDFLESLVGQDGADGKSAYDLWLEAGNTGTEQDFLDSLQGEDGADGQDGLSAYELWIEAGNSGDINDFLESLVGADGQDGTDGAAGQPGVDGKTAYELWIEAGNSGDIDDFLESLVGQDGADGKSAYDLWLEAGNSGTEEEFLASLQGEDGADGQDGLSAYELWLEAGNSGDINDFLESLKGEDGAAGQPGVDGKTAYELWLDAGNEGTVDDFLESLVGQDGADGKSAYDLWLEAGNTGTEEEFLASLQGEDGTDGQDGQDGQDGTAGSGSSGSSNNETVIGSSVTSIGQCSPSNAAPLLALLGVLGAIGIANTPAVTRVLESVGAPVGANAPRIQLFGPNQPAWLVEIDRSLARLGTSASELAGPFAAVVGVVAVLGAANAACNPDGSSADA